MADTPSSTFKTSSLRQRSPIDDLIKCFCETCETWFSRKLVKAALNANNTEILKDSDLRAILSKYLESTHKLNNSDSVAMKIVKSYELADEILMGNCIISDRQNEDLEKSCYWDGGLSKAVKEGTIDVFLKKIKDDCPTRLSEEQEYKDFRAELMQKLNLKKST